MGLLSQDYYTNLTKQNNPVSTVGPQNTNPASIPQPNAPQDYSKLTVTGDSGFQDIGFAADSPYRSLTLNGSGPLLVPGTEPAFIKDLHTNLTPYEQYLKDLEIYKQQTAGFNITGSGPGVPVKPKDPRSFEEKLFNVVKDDDINATKQASRFGGEVGSNEYYNYKAEHPYISFLPQQIGTSFGMRFPDQNTWDKMSRWDQAQYTGGAALGALGRLIKGLPKEVAKAPFRVSATIVAPWTDMAAGNSGSFQSIVENEPISFPWIGEVPTYFHTYAEAREDPTLGPLGAALMTTGLAAGDVAIVGSLGEASAAAMRPKATKLKQGTQVNNVAPIKQALVKGEGELAAKVVNKIESTSEYYSLPRSVIKDNFKGNPQNTFTKITPVNETAVEVSVVQLRHGAIPRAVDYVKNKFGRADKVYKGDFGNEIKLQSQIVELNKPVMVVDDIVEAGAAETVLKGIPPKPLKGFENLAVEVSDIQHLYQIGKVNGLDTGVRDAVIRTITGKNVVGELSKAEYVRAAQALGSMKNINKYTPDAPGVGLFAKYGSPQRHWMRSFEERSGVPLYSEVYVPLEEATRLRDVFRNSKRNEARDIFGKYAKEGFGEERRLVSAYMRGETKVITANKAISDATKTELIDISTKMRALYDDIGPQVDVPVDIFLKDYQPSVQQIGGVYQLYKEGAKIPKEIEFFAKFKKHGNIGIQVDDALALWDIYTNAGSNRVFLNPALERIGNISSKVPGELQNSVNSYVLEKLGYAGNLERSLDRLATGVNQKLGTSLPPDTARQMTSLIMDTTYSGALGANPGKAFRNLIQNDIMTYPRLGPKFYAEAAKKAFNKAAIEEVRAKGFLVELGVPFGEELTKDVTLFGRAGNMYRKGTQATLGPYSYADQINRVRTYHQVKMQFDDAIGKFNDGKMTWKQVEKELDFGALSPVDRNIIRQRLASGNLEGAFDNLVREVLDETHFPYRRGASSRVTYGLGGKLGTQFLQWPIEFAHTHARWIKNKQWDKLIRSYSASAAVSRTLRESANVDFESDVYYNPLRPGFSPFVRGAIDTIEWVNASLQGNDELIEENKEELARAVSSLLVPGGSQIENFKQFKKSYFPSKEGTVQTGGPIGPNGTYPVYDKAGRLKYYTDFKDLWGQLWGFKTKPEEEYNQTMREMRNAKFDYTQAKREVLELYQQERYDEANAIIEEFGINVGPNDFDKYLIPAQERTFQSIPNSLKGKFAPKVFGE